MKSRLFVVLAIATPLIVVVNAFADSLLVATAVTISRDTTFNFVRVTSTGRLTADAIIRVTGKMIIEAGGQVTHSPYPINSGSGLILNVSDTLLVSGSIIVNGLGLRGGFRDNNSSLFGETYNSSEQVVAAVGELAGGSYGGIGGFATIGAAYGLIENPVWMGSGGGAHSGPGLGAGGNGGGLVKITAGQIILNGAISANGGSFSPFRGGGGSGGSIHLTVGRIMGTGKITANGGDGERTRSGSGGGGRIAIFADENALANHQIQAQSGIGGSDKASAGTIYLKKNAAEFGDLIVDNENVLSPLATPLRTKLNTLASLMSKNLGHLHVSGTFVSEAIAIAGPAKVDSSGRLTITTATAMNFNGAFPALQVTNSGTVNVNSGALVTLPTLQVSGNGSSLLSAVDLVFASASDFILNAGGAVTISDTSLLTLPVFGGTNLQGGTLTMHPNARLAVLSDSIVIVAGMTLVKDGRLGLINDQIGKLTVEGNIAHSSYPTNPGTGLNLNIKGTLEVGGSVNVNERGLRGGKRDDNSSFSGETYNSTGEVVAAVRELTGGSYGGIGGFASIDAAYGLIENPVWLGSGGGAHSGPGLGSGGNGGGFVKITAGQIILNGVISANGGNFLPFRGGGGSGGSIHINAGRIAGTGKITANGGDGERTRSGSGGGGRIAMFYDINELASEQIQASSGKGGSDKASAGTIYLRATGNISGNLFIDNDNITTLLFTPLLTSLNTLQDLVIRNKGALNLNSEIAIERNLNVSTGGRIGKQ